MSNHGFLHIPNEVTVKGLDDEIRQIVSERFGQGLRVETHPQDDHYMAVWIITRPGHDYPYRVDIYLTTPTLIETRHPLNDWMFWVSALIFNKLGVNHSGTLSDEGTGDMTWQPDPNKYPTYREWLKRKFPPQLLFKLTARLIYALTPAELKAFDKMPQKG